MHTSAVQQDHASFERLGWTLPNTHTHTLLREVGDAVLQRDPETTAASKSMST